MCFNGSNVACNVYVTNYQINLIALKCKVFPQNVLKMNSEAAENGKQVKHNISKLYEYFVTFNHCWYCSLFSLYILFSQNVVSEKKNSGLLKQAL